MIMHNIREDLKFDFDKLEKEKKKKLKEAEEKDDGNKEAKKTEEHIRD